ncbi:IS66 family insertion sequence element accessory protein TnpB [Shigella sonnei]|nr:IS66 family insertion sequence element accessory protein TnpB [Shigella sonnei]
MIPLPSGTKIWLVAGITDMRNGFNGLAAKVQTTLKDDPMSGHVFIFRGRNGSQVKLLWSTGDGLCLLTKRLERGRFAWPSARDGKVFLTPAQLAMLLEGIDWRQPKRLLTSAAGERITVRNYGRDCAIRACSQASTSLFSQRELRPSLMGGRKGPIPDEPVKPLIGQASQLSDKRHVDHLVIHQ